MLARILSLFLIASLFSACKSGLVFFSDADVNQSVPVNGDENGLNDQDILRSQAQVVLKSQCMNCHTAWSDFKLDSQWVDAGLVTLGISPSSLLLDHIKYGGGIGDMPPKGADKNFTYADYQKIKLWIENMSYQSDFDDDGGGTAEKSSLPSLRLGDRSFVKSVLDSVFGPEASTIATSSVIKRSLSKFGGPCDPFAQIDLSCTNVDLVDFTAPMFGEATTLREASRMKACNLLSFTDSTLKYAITAATGKADLSFLTFTSVPTVAEIQNAYKLFYPVSEDLPEDIISKIMAAATKISTRSENYLDPWRSVILHFCYTPEWQIP